MLSCIPNWIGLGSLQKCNFGSHHSLDGVGRVQGCVRQQLLLCLQVASSRHKVLYPTCPSKWEQHLHFLYPQSRESHSPKQDLVVLRLIDVMIVVSRCINVAHRFGLQSLDQECMIWPDCVGNTIVLTFQVLVVKSHYGKRDLELFHYMDAIC